MDIDQAILTRRTITRFLPKMIKPEKLDQILSAGLWAQNHRLTQPWRFVILGAETHQKLSHLFGRLQANFLPPEAGEAERSAAVEAARRKLRARPKIVVVSSLLRGDAQQRKEDYAATACAIQNIQSSAWPKGVGMQFKPFRRPSGLSKSFLLGKDAPPGGTGKRRFVWPERLIDADAQSAE